MLSSLRASLFSKKSISPLLTFQQSLQMSSKSKKSSSYHPLFSHRSLRDDVWILEEKYFISWNRANIFFIRGAAADLLIDTGKKVIHGGIQDLSTLNILFFDDLSAKHITTFECLEWNFLKVLDLRQNFNNMDGIRFNVQLCHF